MSFDGAYQAWLLGLDIDFADNRQLVARINEFDATPVGAVYDRPFFASIRDTSNLQP
jgi:hypothetical protein